MILNLQSRTLFLILYSLLSGCVLGAVYDMTHTLPSTLQTPMRRGVRIVVAVLIGISDVIFCICGAVIAMLLNYYVGGGFFRGLVFVLLFCGFSLFRHTLGILWRKVLSKIYGVIYVTLKRLIRLAVGPAVFLFCKLKLLYRLTICKIIDKIKERREARRLIAPPMQNATEGERVNVANGYGYKRNGRIRF